MKKLLDSDCGRRASRVTDDQAAVTSTISKSAFETPQSGHSQPSARLPSGCRGDAVLRVAIRFVIDITANDALPSFHDVSFQLIK